MDYSKPIEMSNEETRNKKKCNYLIWIIIILSVLLTTSITLNIIQIVNTKSSPVIPIESIIPVTPDISVKGIIMEKSAAWYNRSNDIQNSPYYPIINFYNDSPSKTLKILPNFKTYQQSSPISCGNAAAFMALRYFGINNVTEFDLYKKADTETDHGTNTVPLGEAIKSLAGFAVDVEYKTDDSILTPAQTLELVKMCTDSTNNMVLLLASVEWGGHWMTLIGYDDMGTSYTDDDVLIFADPFDTTDHNQDGYYTISYERYFATWYLHNIGKEGQKVNQYVRIIKKS